MPPALRRVRGRRRSLPDLSTDTLLYIIQFLDPYDYGTKDNTISLASTNKLLRGLALPVIFSTLHLGAPYEVEEENLQYIKKVVQRVQDINSVPHILSAIRRLTLFHWPMCPHDNDDDDEDYVTNEPGFDSVGYRARFRESLQLLHEGYRATVTLLSRLPRLYHLKCYHCRIIPEVFPYIFRIPNLQSLHLQNCFTSTDDPIKLQVTAPLLHVFQYSEPSYKLCRADAVKLFISFISQFTVLSFPLDILGHILADNSLPITLPKLQQLSLFKHGQDDCNDLIYIHKFLSLTPNLRELCIISYIHSNTPFILPDTMIPHLKILLAPSYIANNIVPGRALDEIHIFTLKPRVFQDDYTVVSPDIKHVVYRGALNDPKEELSHLARVFPNATTVNIVVMKECTQSSKELSNAILFVLPKFRHLKQCKVCPVVWGMFPSDCNPPSHCPVGRVGDPKHRSHPTLEELRILGCYVWTWIPEDGWYPVHQHCRVGDIYLFDFFELSKISEHY